MATATGVEMNSESAIVKAIGTDVIPDDHRELVKSAVVFIDTKDSSIGTGTGFVCTIPDLIHLAIVTCHHVLPTESAALKSTFHFRRISDEIPGSTIAGSEIVEKFITCQDLDFTVLYIKEAAGLPSPLCLTEHEKMYGQELKKGNQLYVVHYPKIPGTYFKRHENAFQAANIQFPFLGHKLHTEPGSSGCPVFREYNSRLVIVGVHRGDVTIPIGQTRTKLNLATMAEAIVKYLKAGTISYSFNTFNWTQFAAEMSGESVGSESNKEVVNKPQPPSNPNPPANPNPPNKRESKESPAVKGDWKAVLQAKLWTYLNDNLNIKEIVEQLYEGVDGKSLLTEALYGKIKSATNIPDANALYLNHLKSSGGKRSFKNFYKILRQTQNKFDIHEEIADAILNEPLLAAIVDE